MDSGIQAVSCNDVSIRKMAGWKGGITAAWGPFLAKQTAVN
jgi:hypothetical protein